MLVLFHATIHLGVARYDIARLESNIKDDGTADIVIFRDAE